MTAGQTSPLRLTKAMRLRQQRDFTRIKSEGKRVVSGCLIANWCELAPGSQSRLGVVTGRRIGQAVERSKARRLLRESFRLHQHELQQPVDLVLVARASIAGKKLRSVECDLLAALRRASLFKMRS